MRAQPFASASEFRRWLEKNHASERELLLLFQRKDSGRGGITYAEALDEALCYGWIDGVRKGVDAKSYTIRFTPRKPRSVWSLVNIRHVERLRQLGRMQPAGENAFAAREARRTGVYSFENKPERLPPKLERVFRANSPAWSFFAAQPPGYRRTLLWWILSAKQEATQQRRLDRLIEVSATDQRVDLMAPFGRGKS